MSFVSSIIDFFNPSFATVVLVMLFHISILMACSAPNFSRFAEAFALFYGFGSFLKDAFAVIRYLRSCMASQYAYFPNDTWVTMLYHCLAYPILFLITFGGFHRFDCIITYGIVFGARDCCILFIHICVYIASLDTKDVSNTIVAGILIYGFAWGVHNDFQFDVYMIPSCFVLLYGVLSKIEACNFNCIFKCIEYLWCCAKQQTLADTQGPSATPVCQPSLSAHDVLSTRDVMLARDVFSLPSDLAKLVNHVCMHKRLDEAACADMVTTYTREWNTDFDAERLLQLIHAENTTAIEAILMMGGSF